MNVALFFRGLMIGLSIAATVGPMSLLCIQRTIEHGRVYGLLSGMGIATADGLYGSIAGFGLTIITHFLVSQQLWIRLIGGLFLVYLGAKTLVSKLTLQAAKVQAKGMLGAYASTLLLTLTNPLTILSFIAIFASVGLGNTRSNAFDAVTVVVAVFCGSALWWLILTTLVSVIRTKMNARLLLWMNRVSGGVILLFGIVAVVSVML
jgi:threonine/homoserine/homoserine lactone efflux protein